MKTQHEVAVEFLENLITKSDDELLAILNQEFTSEDYGGDEIYNLDTFTEVAELFETTDNSRCAFQVLAVLCALNKEKSFDRLKNHYRIGSFKGEVYFVDGERVNKVTNNKSLVFNISFPKIAYNELKDELKVIGDTIWVAIPKDYFEYGWDEVLKYSGGIVNEFSPSEIEHVSKSSGKVTFAIPLEALKEDPIDEDELNDF